MKNLKFSDVAKFINDKVELSNLQNEQYISTENMLPNYGGIVEIDKLPKIEKCNKFKQGDILFSNIRTYFKKVWVAEFSGGCSPDVLIIRSKDESIVRTSYLYLLICSDDFINFTVASSNGAKMPRGDKNAIKNYIFNIPDIAFQDKAINTYFRFKKKITLNTQTNQTLEQIAQAIFKHWFIDFAPVHAKANALARGETIEQAELAAMACLSGKTAEKITALKTQDPTTYHQLQQTAAAFPSEFVESEMGLVPKGWEVKPINEICSIVYGKGLPKNQLKSSGYPVYGANGVIGYYDQYLYKTRQVLIGCRGTVGQVYVSQPYSYITSNSLIIEDTKTILNLYFLELYLKNLDLSVFASGSVQPQITIQNLSRLKIFIPNKEILDLFSSLVEPMYQLTYKNDDEKKTLSEIRDFLLPKLLNGEIEL
ncbi:hypothetical protein IO43_09820 [Gallibacterium anatis 7990]|uniref:restriction endonuclease subunit S n=1 Tax=Gallibacterium anatis TaxID=750 RepID=UPI0005320E33|nr:restriction endonuclease subunit S [Gallibacterium anatis]KGQ62462.1 hypothetical protein IO43_09820 [Gallibacterium anatis 7990]